MSEQELQIQVAQYLRLQYPNVLFHSDYGSGVKLTARQASIQKRQNGGQRGWPDMFIAEPMFDAKMPEDAALAFMPGLFLELKKEGTRLFKKDGSYASEHIREQDEVMDRLRNKGYTATFACGFDEAKMIIDDYLGGKR